MAGFWDTYDLKSLITEPVFYKDPRNPVCCECLHWVFNFQTSQLFEKDLP